MTKQETGKIVAVMIQTWKYAYSPGSETVDIENEVNFWWRYIGAYAYQDVCRALDEFIRIDTKGFPPKPGQLIAILDRNKEENAAMYKKVQIEEKSTKMEMPKELHEKLKKGLGASAGKGISIQERVLSDCAKKSGFCLTAFDPNGFSLKHLSTGRSARILTKRGEESLDDIYRIIAKTNIKDPDISKDYDALKREIKNAIQEGERE